MTPERRRPSPRPRVAGERGRARSDEQATEAITRPEPRVRRPSPSPSPKPPASKPPAVKSPVAKPRGSKATGKKPAARSSAARSSAARSSAATGGRFARLLPRPSRWTRPQWSAVGGALAVACLALAAVGWMLWSANREAGRADTAVVLDAAKRAVVKLYNYDSTTIDKNIADALSATTGTYRELYTKDTSTTIKPMFSQLGAKLAVSDITVGLKSLNADRDQAQVVVFMTLTTSSAIAAGGQQPVNASADCQPTVDGTGLRCGNQVLLTLDWVKDEWLVSQTSSVPAAQPQPPASTAAPAPTN